MLIVKNYIYIYIYLYCTLMFELSTQIVELCGIRVEHKGSDYPSNAFFFSKILCVMSDALKTFCQNCKIS